MITGNRIDLDGLKRSIDIAGLAAELGLEVRNRQARCFNSAMHTNNDRHFSLGFDVKTNRFKCFACGESGTNIDLYMKVRGVSFPEAIQHLAQKAGYMPQQTLQRPKYKNRDNTGNKNSPDTAHVFNPQNSKIYRALECFCDGVDQESLDYLTGMKRGLSPETIKRFRLFSIKNYRKVNEYLTNNFSLEDLEGAGLLSRKNDTKEERNTIFYKHKIIIPFVTDGRITYLQGRRLDDEHPRYLNIRPDVPLFNAALLKELHRGERIYVCEGVFDAMILQQYGYNAVAILGVNNLKQHMITALNEYDVVLVLDNDEAGRRATQEMAKIFLLNGKKIKTKRLPADVKDVTEFFLQPDIF